MSNLSLVDIKVIAPIVECAPIGTYKLESLVEECGLPASIVETQVGLQPLHSIELLLNRVQSVAGDPLFLYRCLGIDANARPGAIANIPLPQKMTGLEAAQLFIQNTSGCLIGADFFIEAEGDRVWFLRTAGTTEWTNNWPVQQYNLSVVLRGLRQVLGHTINPDAIRLSQIPLPQELPDEFRDCEIILSQHVLGLAIKIDNVVNASSFANELNKSNGQKEPTKNQTFDASDIRKMLEVFLLDTETEHSCSRIARSFGMSERSYRRRLAELDVTHKQLVSDARMSRSIAMLNEHSLSVTRIAMELGFHHAPAFTRFFKSRVGVTPTEFRAISELRR